MIDAMKDLIRPTPLYGILRHVRDRRLAAQWRASDRLGPPPHIIKAETIRDYGRRFGARVLIETGTFHGAMVHQQRRAFQRIISIEIDEALHQKAVRLFARYPHIEILRGDSGEVIPRVLALIDEPCVFWLDGHYSGGITGRGTADTPIAKELAHIFAHRVRDHVILIDDARHFTGENDYPTLDALRAFVLGQRPGWRFEVADDIIRIHS
jgi:hypothetical protein